MSGHLELGLVRRRKVRLVRQTEVSECGLAALAMIANYHGMDVDLAALRRRHQPSLRGAALATLLSVAGSMGLEARALKISLDDLDHLGCPAILHWDMNHYVVLETVRKGRALIHDPGGCSRWMEIAAVSPHFTGIALELAPSPAFDAVTDRQRLRFSQLWRKMTGLKRALAQTLVLSLVMQTFVLASPYFMQLGIDSALPALDYDLVTVLALGFGLFTLINAMASLLRSLVLLSAGTSLGYGIATNIGRRLFRLPVSWFEKRHVGDVLSRFQSIMPIRQFLTEGALAGALDGSLTILTVCMMFFYSPLLTFVALGAFAIFLILRLALFTSQRVAQDDVISANGREQSLMIESLRGITTLRIFGAETARHAQWQQRLVDAMNATVSMGRLAAWQTSGNALVFGVETVISIWLALQMVLDGGFSLGMLFAFMAYKTQFVQKSGSLLDQFFAFRMIGLHLERLSDVVLQEEDRALSENGRSSTDFSGAIEFRRVCFRYSSSDPQVLDNVDFKIEAGEHVAITGPSGGGKSTIVKLMLGLATPTSGQILVDGMPLEDFGYRRFHELIGAVLQHDHLFAGSFADNIALFDEQPDRDRIQAAAAAASFHNEIAAMPMGYETLVGDMGSSLSGGQKQRLLLARSLYRRPKLLIMDEGTAHLDAAKEQLVNSAMAQLGMTKVVIAHRAETIRCAQRVLFLDQGKISEVGHDFVPEVEQTRFVHTPAPAVMAAE